MSADEEGEDAAGTYGDGDDGQSDFDHDSGTGPAQGGGSMRIGDELPPAADRVTDFIPSDLSLQTHSASASGG